MSNRNEEIETIIKLLRTAWLANPELRLGQLVVVALRTVEACPEMFYATDRRAKSALRKLNFRQIEGRS